MFTIEDTDFLIHLASNGGPEQQEYDALDDVFLRMNDQFNGNQEEKKLAKRSLWEAMGPAFSLETMQGKVALKPHGYAGDFETIDQIYTEWVSEVGELKKWDYFFHYQSATKAVRNRKAHLATLLSKLVKDKPFRVLNIGSGPGRDVAEYLEANSSIPIHFDFVDTDPNAISYAKKICLNHADKIDYFTKNIFRFRTEHKYDLIWSAGLFDYLSDNQFCFLLKKLHPLLNENGLIAIGNFSTENPSRAYMETGEWFLNYRDQNHLHDLAIRAEYSNYKINIESESEGVNLFLNLQHK